MSHECLDLVSRNAFVKTGLDLTNHEMDVYSSTEKNLNWRYAVMRKFINLLGFCTNQFGSSILRSCEM